MRTMYVALDLRSATSDRTQNRTSSILTVEVRTDREAVVGNLYTQDAKM